jgi:hypothetical protein
VPSGPLKIAWWQLPLSMMSPWNSTPAACSSSRAAGTSST